MCIWNLDPFRIPEAILMPELLKFDTDVVVSVTFDMSSLFC